MEDAVGEGCSAARLQEVRSGLRYHSGTTGREGAFKQEEGLCQQVQNLTAYSDAWHAE